MYSTRTSFHICYIIHYTILSVDLLCHVAYIQNKYQECPSTRQCSKINSNVHPNPNPNVNINVKSFNISVIIHVSRDGTVALYTDQPLFPASILDSSEIRASAMITFEDVIIALILRR